MRGQENELIHQPLRLKIMAVLNAHPEKEGIEFARLKAIVDATDGNLGAHLATLEKAAYIAVAKDFVGKKPRTRVSISRDGRRAFEQHVAYLKEILEG
ncbi:MAG TPA: transcriptional regulator [Steroidobacteraceae bacterium]|nr:transcriptional regulator [Steroidobacteraceae bacterium]